MLRFPFHCWPTGVWGCSSLTGGLQIRAQPLAGGVIGPVLYACDNISVGTFIACEWASGPS
jgi:hypothetical protein